MTDPPSSEEIRAWMSKAREDLRVAKVIRDAHASASLAAFHCQQAVEKYLKAVLVARGVDVPRVHDLEELAARIPGPAPELGASTDDLRRATAYSVAPRYPSFPTEQAERDLPALVAIADRVAAAIEAALDESSS